MTKYTKKVSVGEFLKKGTDFKKDDMVVIKNEGQPVQGTYGVQHVFKIKAGEKEGNVSFNQTSLNNLIDAFGEDAANWIDKEVKVEMIRQNVQGAIKAVYYFLHPDTVLDEESGKFVLPNQPTQPDEVGIDDL